MLRKPAADSRDFFLLEGDLTREVLGFFVAVGEVSRFVAAIVLGLVLLDFLGALSLFRVWLMEVSVGVQKFPPFGIFLGGVDIAEGFFVGDNLSRVLVGLPEVGFYESSLVAGLNYRLRLTVGVVLFLSIFNKIISFIFKFWRAIL